MEEKILAQSKHYNVKMFTIIMSVIAVVLSVSILAYCAIDTYSYYSNLYHKEEWEPYYLCECTERKKIGTNVYGYNKYSEPLVKTQEEFYERHPDLTSFMECREVKLIYDDEFMASCIPLSLIVLAAVLYLWLSSYQLIVTDKRVYGKAAFGKRVDLPIDSISAVGTSFLKGIDVGTSSGRIKFKLIKNQEDIHSVMSKLLMERQQKETKNTAVENTISTSNADELKKFKELLDSGVITQEEFDEKKKQLLGL